MCLTVRRKHIYKIYGGDLPFLNQTKIIVFLHRYLCAFNGIRFKSKTVFGLSNGNREPLWFARNAFRVKINYRGSEESRKIVRIVRLLCTIVNLH